MTGPTLADALALIQADLDQADAWAALGVVAAVTKTRLTPREETALAALQDAARQRVVLTTNAHAQALAQWRKDNPA
jgi:hypothetical protein